MIQDARLLFLKVLLDEYEIFSEKEFLRCLDEKKMSEIWNRYVKAEIDGYEWQQAMVDQLRNRYPGMKTRFVREGAKLIAVA